MEYQVPLWVVFLSLIIGGLAGMFAIALAAIGKRSDLELEIFTLRDKNKEIETKLKESFAESVRLRTRNIELRENYAMLKKNFIKLDRKFIELKDQWDIETFDQATKGD